MVKINEAVSISLSKLFAILNFQFPSTQIIIIIMVFFIVILIVILIVLFIVLLIAGLLHLLFIDAKL